MAKLTRRKSAKAKPGRAAGRKTPSRTPSRRGAKPADIVRPPIGKSRRISAKSPEPVSVKRKNSPEPQPPAPPQKAAVNNRPIKNLAGLKAKDLSLFRELLLAKRRELLGDMHSMEQEALQTSGHSNLSNLPIHMADMGTDNYEQEFTLGLVEKDRQLLREINAALMKMRDGTYGICEGTGKPISRARLEAQPWARFSIEYARSQEKAMGRM